MTFPDFTITVAKILLVMGVLLTMVPLLVWAERRGSAFMQDRLGPNRVGPFGLFQPIADALKFIFKEDPIPIQAHQKLFVLAPLFSFLPAAIVFAAIPFGDTIDLYGKTIVLQIADMNIGILYVLAIASLGVYGILIAGWSSNNKYSTMGALRSSAQMISYEIAAGAALIGPLLVYGTFSLREMVLLQPTFWSWGIVFQPVAFLIFLISSIAECNRLPFDLPEGESELVAGYHTEYGSMKFAIFFMAEYLHMVTISALIVTLFLGGWQPLHGMLSLADGVGLPVFPSSLELSLLKVASFCIKTAGMILFVIWIRWTFPRFRYDQLMSFGWKILVPLAFANILITSTLIYLKILP